MPKIWQYQCNMVLCCQNIEVQHLCNGLLINGENNKTGVYNDVYSKRMDTGDMTFKTKSITISQQDTYGSIHNKLSVARCTAFWKQLQRLQNGTLVQEYPSKRTRGYLCSYD